MVDSAYLRGSSSSAFMLHTDSLCYAKTNALALFEENTSIDFSDWPLHTHRFHLFEPLQSALLKEGFFYS